MTYLDTLPDCDELLADRKHAAKLRRLLAAHPDPRDPDYPIDLEAQAEHDADVFADMVAEVRRLLAKSEKLQNTGYGVNVRLALSDAAAEITAWLENTK
jgi:hypothetical protein